MPNNEPQDIAGRLERIEQRLDALEQGVIATPYQRRKKRKEVPGIRTTRVPAILIGIFIFMFGWELFPELWNVFIGLGLVLYGIIIGKAVPPVYVDGQPAAEQRQQPVPQQTKAAPTQRNVETDIGKRIFSWLGIITLLIGVTFFVGYSFQNFGVSGKLAVGYTFAVLLLGFGRWMRGHVRGFSYVLEGGGWAALYFMTYALSFVKDVAVIDNHVVTLGLLLLVVVAMALVSLAERSQVFTAGAFLLGYLTAAVGGKQESFTLWTVLFLSLAVFAIAMRYRWYAFSVGGTIATYIAFHVWASNLVSPIVAGTFLTGELFLIPYGNIFAIGHLLPRPKTQEEESVILVGTVLNTVFAFSAALYLLDLANLDLWIAPLVFTGILGAFYVVTMFLRHGKKLQTTYLLLAIAALTAFLGMRFTDSTLTILWIVEAAMLVAIGTATHLSALRTAGYVTSLIATVSVVGEIGRLPEGIEKSGIHIIAVLFAAAVWLILCGVLHLLRQNLHTQEKILGAIYGDVAVFFLVLLAQIEITDNFISIATGLAGIMVLIIGFALANKHIRGLGLAVLLFTIARVFLFDISGLDTFGRMISFIVLGIVLLGAAYLYNRLRDREDTSQTSQS